MDPSQPRVSSRKLRAARLTQPRFPRATSLEDRSNSKQEATSSFALERPSGPSHSFTSALCVLLQDTDRLLLNSAETRSPPSSAGSSTPQILCHTAPLESARLQQCDIFPAEIFNGHLLGSSGGKGCGEGSEPREFPSGAMMAELLEAYHRQLEQQCLCGDVAAAAGCRVLGKVRAGLADLVINPCHGASPFASADWHKDEGQLEGLLRELEKDVGMLEHYHDQQPANLAVLFTSVHCQEAARLLRRL